MRNFDNFYEYFIRVRNQINNDRPRIALGVAFGLNARIQLRLQETGEDSNDVPFSPYRPLSVKLRNKRGYQVAYVDFTQTGAFLRNIQPRVISNTEGSTIIQIAPTRQSEVAKYKNNERYRKGFYKPSRRDIAATVLDTKQRVLNLIKVGL